MANDDQKNQDEAVEEVEAVDEAGQTDDGADQEDRIVVDEVAELKSQLQRLAAEFDNYRRRTEAERKQLIPMAQAKTLLEITPVLDNFRRATDHLPEDLKGNNWVTGVLYVEKQLEQIFEQSGVNKIKTIGEQFDPKFHEAIGSEPSEEPADTIIAEVEGGYLLNGVVLKPARVKVSSGPELVEDADKAGK